MQRMQAREGTPTTGSQTVTPAPEETQREPSPLMLHLHALPHPDERRVTWDEDVIDNENMGKKSSKVCCIYHKPRAFGESSEESSSFSSSDDDSSDGDERARWINRRRNDNPDEHNHDQDLPNGGQPCAKHANSRRFQKQQKKKKRRPSPNAYERMPKHERKKEEQNAVSGEGSSGKEVEDK